MEALRRRTSHDAFRVWMSSTATTSPSSTPTLLPLAPFSPSPPPRYLIRLAASVPTSQLAFVMAPRHPAESKAELAARYSSGIEGGVGDDVWSPTCNLTLHYSNPQRNCADLKFFAFLLLRLRTSHSPVHHRPDTLVNLTALPVATTVCALITTSRIISLSSRLPRSPRTSTRLLPGLNESLPRVHSTCLLGSR